MAEAMSNNNDKKLIQIDVSSDTVCLVVFCGEKKNLDKAIDLVKDQFHFKIRGHPYILDANAPKGVPKKVFFEKKIGAPVPQMFARLTGDLGLEYDITGLTEFLLECARKVGVEGAAEFLNDPNNGLKEVNKEFEEYFKGITGVPYYVINGKVKLSGGQPPQTATDGGA